MATATIGTPVQDGDRARDRGIPIVRCAAELAECTCPEPCERDHDRD